MSSWTIFQNISILNGSGRGVCFYPFHCSRSRSPGAGPRTGRSNCLHDPCRARSYTPLPRTGLFVLSPYPDRLRSCCIFSQRIRAIPTIRQESIYCHPLISPSSMLEASWLPDRCWDLVMCGPTTPPDLETFQPVGTLTSA